MSTLAPRLCRIAILTATVAVAVGGCRIAWASGFQLREESGEGLGNAYAGSTAKAYDVGTLFYNPAGMTRLHGDQAGASTAWIAPSSRFKGSDTLGGTAISGSTGDNHLTGVAVGAAYVMMDLGPDWRLGLAIATPFGMRSDYKDDWVGRYQALDSRLTTVNASPSLAWRVNDHLSVAAGLQIDWANTLLSNAINFGALVPGSGDGQFRASGEDVALGWTASALYEFAPTTRAGVSYRSAVRHAIRGSAEFQGVPQALADSVSFADSRVKTTITLPDTANFGIYHEMSPQWAVMSDVAWTRWSVFRTLRLDFESGRDELAIPENWRDTWFFSVGTSYKPNERLTLHLGTAYDMSPVGDRFRNARLPDSARFWLSGGASYAIAPGHQFSLSYAHLFAGSANIDQTDPQGIGGRLLGHYDNHVDVFSASYTLKF